MLIGRERDIERINKAVLNRSLVVLDGDSGVGKSSLLQNGLFARLAYSGLGLLVNRSWTGIAAFGDADMDVDAYLAAGIRETHARSGIPLPRTVSLEDFRSGDGLCTRLDKAYPKTAAVLILDQFEELLRQATGRAERVVRWIVEAGFRYRMRVVISLRTDSLHHLDPLLRGVKPFSMDRVRLKELDDVAAIRTVISTPRSAENLHREGGSATEGSSQPPLIDPAAVDHLMELWSGTQPKPKLLDLQATLYALHFLARDRRPAMRGTHDEGAPHEPAAAEVGATIQLADVEQLASDARAQHSNLFALGLREAIRLKIQHAEKASRAIEVDEYLLSGALEVVKKAAPLLSSGDFKVPMHQFELAWRTLDRERRVLEHALLAEERVLTGRSTGLVEDDRIIRAMVNELFGQLLQAGDFLAVPGKEIPFVAERLEKLKKHPLPLRSEVTAGPLMHRTATETLLEEIRRVVFAIEWLGATEITRKDPDGTLLLVHDRAGEALKTWVEAQVDHPEQALRQLTGARGEHFVWDKEEKQGIGKLDSDYRVIANLSWRDCRIVTSFRHVVFVNCDFSGSRFERCTFEGVTFVNCLLDDVNFEYCVIRGKISAKPVKRRASDVDAEGRKTRLAPSFTVEDSIGEVENFAAYKSLPSDEPLPFFSDTSGVAAVPGLQPKGHAGELLAHFAAPGSSRPGGPPRDCHGSVVREVAPTRGGVAMMGGRLCFLTLYRCRSEDRGAFALHHVSGGGLDIVEQYGGTVHIHDSAIRGISITRDEDDSADTDTAQVKLVVHDSVVVNIYFADRLSGLAVFVVSVVLMLINASDNQKFRTKIEKCRYQFLVNTDDPKGPEDSRQFEPEKHRYFRRIDETHSRFSTPNDGLLGSDLEVMDYVARPELRERRLRARRAAARTGSTLSEQNAQDINGEALPLKLAEEPS